MRRLLTLTFITFTILLCSACNSVFPASDETTQSRPIGNSCNLSVPPIESGEEGGHGIFLQVFPRMKDIDSNYTGCQAVFATTKTMPVQLAWLVQVVKGDPIRMWSTSAELREQLDCHWKQGVLLKGNSDKCKAPELMLSQPAGCLKGSPGSEVCDYDSK